MRKRNYASLGIILVALLIPTISMAVASKDKYIYRTATEEEVHQIVPNITYLGPLNGVKVVKPDFTYQYVDDNRNLSTNSGVNYGTYYPYAVSVRINTISPSGYTLTCTIKVNGATQWSGELGAGQSSPTITANGQSTEVIIFNWNDVSIHYTSSITLTYN